MISLLDIQEAENEAMSLIKRSNIHSLPVCPFKIASDHGIEVQPKESSKPGVSGFLVRVGNTFGIQYATHIKVEGFIRFTIAHELGHYFLPGHPEHLFPNGDGIHKSKSGTFSGDIFEKQADHFAKTLLMPETFFIEALRDAGGGFASVETLSTKCMTSFTATAIRITEFSEDPFAVIMSNGNKVEWCFLSKPLKQLKTLERLRKGNIIPPNTLTATFNHDHNKIISGERTEGWTDLGNWFEGAPGLEMKEDVVGLGTYGKTLTTLFSNDAIDDNDYNDDED
jgi:hypothetical protein